MSPADTPTNTGALDLVAAAEEVLAEARAAKAGRAGRTLTPGAGVPLKQALLALRAGEALADHASPGEATLYVLSGAVQLTAGERATLLRAGAFATIPSVPHGLEALDDAVLLITVATRQRPA